MDARSWTAAGSTLFLLYLYLGILVGYAGSNHMICSPSELVWVFAGMAAGGTAGILYLMWRLERWMNESNKKTSVH